MSAGHVRRELPIPGNIVSTASELVIIKLCIEIHLDRAALKRRR